MKRKYLSLAIGCVLVAPTLPAFSQEVEQPAVAATTGQDQAATLDRVEVTARRRVESIQDVPVAVSAFGEEQLRDLQANHIDGLQGAVPNMNIVQGRGSSNSVNVFIRGIGQPDALHTFDPGVGMYVDDVYYSRINGALLSMFDVQQVEVLRGPQGTLYGKNSTGGAVKVTTKNPFEDTSRAVELGVGEFGRTEGRAYIAGSSGDVLAASLAGGWISSDGHIQDPVTGKKYNGEDTFSLRGKLVARPTEEVTITFAADYTDQDAALTLGRPTAPLIRTDVVLGPVVLLTPDSGEFDFRTRTSFRPDQGQEMTHKGLSATVDWDINNAWAFKSITAWRALKADSYIDIDASEFELGDVLVAFDQNQVSQELQLQYDNGSNLQAIFGAYYMSEDVPSHQEAYASDFFGFIGAPIDFLRTIDDELNTQSVAAFAHVTWEFSPTWSLSSGLRYSKDTKDYRRTTSTFWGAPFQAISLDPESTVDASASWDAWTPSLSLQKSFSDQVMGYVSANRGFKSGGFNGRANGVNEAANPKFDPEFVWTYEAGVKMRSANGRLLGNVAAFHSAYEDFQARVSWTPPGTIDTTFPVLNAAKLSINGIELEGTAMLGESTRLMGQLSYLDAKYDEFVDPRVAIDPTLASLHDHVPFSPEFTARLALQHTFDLNGSGALTIGGDASYRSETWLSVDNRPGLMQEGYTLLGLYGAWDSPQYVWQVRAGVRNLTDEVYKIDGQEFSSVANIQTAYYGRPRDWYMSVRYNF